MDKDLEQRLVRLEGKINVIAKAIQWMLAAIVGFAVFELARDLLLLTGSSTLAAILGLLAGLGALGLFEWQMRRLETWFPYKLDG